MNHNDRLNGSGIKDPTAFAAISASDIEAAVKESPVVYICSPFSGQVEKNITNAKRYTRFAIFHGAVPFTPHLLFPQVLDDDLENERNLAMGMNKAMLGICNELWVFGKYLSPGMKAEISWAKKNRMKTRYFTENCKETDMYYSKER